MVVSIMQIQNKTKEENKQQNMTMKNVSSKLA